MSQVETNAVSKETTEQELARLRKENADLKQAQSSGLGMKVSARGAVSVYGLGKFPVTLYKGQWQQLIARIPAIEAFIKANDDKLTVKPEKLENVDETAA